jgi:hypothetical protein
MRRLLMLLGAPVVIVLATPAQADPSSAPNDDVDFLKQMSDAGLSYHDPKQAVMVAKSVCDLADKGTSQTDIEKNLLSENPSFTSGGVRKFVILSAGEYCPKYMPTQYQPKPPADGDSPKPASP